MLSLFRERPTIDRCYWLVSSMKIQKAEDKCRVVVFRGGGRHENGSGSGMFGRTSRSCKAARVEMSFERQNRVTHSSNGFFQLPQQQFPLPAVW